MLRQSTFLTFSLQFWRHKNGQRINFNEKVKVDNIKKNLKYVNSDYGSCIPVAQRYPVAYVNNINFGFQYENVSNSKAVKQIHTSWHEKCSTLIKIAFFKTFALRISKFYPTLVSPRSILTE
jgi:hypothetical protein